MANETTTGSNAEYTDIESNSAYGSPFRYGTFGDTNIINGGAATNGVYGSINFVTSGSIRMTIAGGTVAGNVGETAWGNPIDHDRPSDFPILSVRRDPSLLPTVERPGERRHAASRSDVRPL